MKKFKKTLICAAACVTAISMTALTACTNNETPGTGLSADVTVAEAMSSEELGVQITRFNNSTAASLSVNGGLTMTKQGDDEINMPLATISASASFADGNADVTVGVNSLLFGDGEGGENGGSQEGNDVVTQSDEEAAEPEFMELSVYLRNWFAIYPNMEEAGYEFIDLSAMLGEGAGMEISDMLTTLAGSFMQDSTMLLTLANTTDSIVVDETQHTVTLNINKMIYGVYDYIRQIINNLTQTTTITAL